MVVIAECVFCFLRKHMHVYDGIILCQNIAQNAKMSNITFLYI